MSVEEDKPVPRSRRRNFLDLGQAAVNGLSLGLQIVDDQPLQFLGRGDDVHEGLAAPYAQQALRRVSFDPDLCAGPASASRTGRRELNAALRLGHGPSPLYQLRPVEGPGHAV